jgi:hypothetical protein
MKAVLIGQVDGWLAPEFFSPVKAQENSPVLLGS